MDVKEQRCGQVHRGVPEVQVDIRLGVKNTRSCSEQLLCTGSGTPRSMPGGLIRRRYR